MRLLLNQIDFFSSSLQSTLEILKKTLDFGNQDSEDFSTVCLPKFDEAQDSAETIKLLFDEIDQNHDNVITKDEMDHIFVKYRHESEFISVLLEYMSDSIDEINFETFSQIVSQIPRPRGLRIQWIKSLELEYILARKLRAGHFFDELQGIREMTDSELDKVCDGFLFDFKKKLKFEVKKLRYEKQSATAHEANSKFSMDGAFTGRFATLNDFYEGPEALVGTPNPRVMDGMQNEHLKRTNADVMFVTSNYLIQTCPRWEWVFVVDPLSATFRFPHTPKDRMQWSAEEQIQWKGDHGRDIHSLSEFIGQSIAKEADLKNTEIIGLRLYTGPMFNLYNAALRNFPPSVVEALHGNRYETTIFAICSGVSKLAKCTAIPPNRLLYRGLGGMLLPRQFWAARGDGFRGAVEWGLMSTTADRAVAVQYSGVDRRRGTVFEIACGRIDVGAVLTWLSQYPGEAEYLFPPLSCLEVVGEPRVEAAAGGEVVVFPLRVNVCLKCLTLEQLVARRQRLHLAMIKNAREELGLEVGEVAAAASTLLTSRRRGAVELMQAADARLVDLDEQDFVVGFNNRGAKDVVGAPWLLVESGRAYFEVELLSACSHIWLGFAATNFCGANGGSPGDSNSWAFNGYSARAGHGERWEQVNVKCCSQAGDVVGVALDLDEGSLRAVVRATGPSSDPESAMAFASGVLPGPGVGRCFFPVISGAGPTVVGEVGPKFRYNFGLDGRPLKCLPEGFRSVADAALPLLALEVGEEEYLDEFERMASGHRNMEAESFNEDCAYRVRLAEVLDLKERLVNKQVVVVQAWNDGASSLQLALLNCAPASDFQGKLLESECPLYSWRSVFSGWLDVCQSVVLPLEQTPCQIAFFFEGILKSTRMKRVTIGDVNCEVSDLVPALSLEKMKLHYEKYQNAILGLVLACAHLLEGNTAIDSFAWLNGIDDAAEGQDLSEADWKDLQQWFLPCERLHDMETGRTLTSVDLRCMEFSHQRVLELGDALTQILEMDCVNGVRSPPESFSALLLGGRPPMPFDGMMFTTGQSGSALSDCLAWPSMAGSRAPLCTYLRPEHWAFIAMRVAMYGWDILLLKGIGLNTAAARGLAPFMGLLSGLRSLNLSDNELEDETVAVLAEPLGAMSSLRALDLGENKRLGSAGFDVLLRAVDRTQVLERLNGFDIAGLLRGTLVSFDLAAGRRPSRGMAASCCDYLPRSASCLTSMNLNMGGLGASGAKRLAEVLPALSCVRVLALGSCDLGSLGGALLAPALPALPLVQLNLNGNGLGGEGAKALCPSLALLTSLESLGLNNNGAGAAAMSQLAHDALPRLTSLRTLLLGANQSDDAATLAVAQAVVGIPSLTRLELGFKGRLGGLDGDRYGAATKQECQRVLAALGEWNRSAQTGLYMD